MAFDILGYRNANKDFFKDASLEDVAKDAFKRGGYDKQYPDYDTWKKEKGVDAVMRAENPPKEGTALGALGKTLLSVPENLAASAITAVQGGSGASVTDRGIGDKFVNWVTKRNEELSKEYEGTGDVIPGVISKQDIAELGQNLAFSGVSMGASLVGGAAGSVAGPLGIVAGRMGGGGLAAHRMQSYQTMNEWLNRKNEESIQNFGRPISPEEEAAFKEKFEGLASKSGLWEAGPEAVGNALELAIILAKSSTPAGKFIPDSMIKKLGKGALTLGKLLGVEEATETITQMGQHNVEVEAGMSSGKPREWTSPEDLLTSAKEVLPAVLLLSGFMGGAGAVYNRLKEAENTPELENEITKLKIGALATQFIDTGLKTGEVDGDPFTVDNAMEIIREAHNSGIYDDENIEHLKERYPQLRNGLNDVITEDIISKIDKQASPRPDSISQVKADMERTKKIIQARNTETDVPPEVGEPIEELPEEPGPNIGPPVIGGPNTTPPDGGDINEGKPGGPKKPLEPPPSPQPGPSTPVNLGEEGVENGSLQTETAIAQQPPETGAALPAFADMVAEAQRWKGASLNADALYGEDKKARLEHSRTTTKGDLDAYLMKKYGIDAVTARNVSNELTAKNLPADTTAKVEDFKGEPWAEKALAAKEPEAPAAPEAKPKEPWEMSAVEVGAKYPNPEGNQESREPWMMPIEYWSAWEAAAFNQVAKPPSEKARMWHKGQVRNAVMNKKPVPPEVLKDYPDLQKPVQAPPSTEATHPEPDKTPDKKDIKIAGTGGQGTPRQKLTTRFYTENGNVGSFDITDKEASKNIAGKNLKIYDTFEDADVARKEWIKEEQERKAEAKKKEEDEDYKKYQWREQNKKENDIILDSFADLQSKYFPDDYDSRNKAAQAFTKYRDEHAKGGNWWDKSLEEKQAGLKEFEQAFFAKTAKEKKSAAPSQASKKEQAIERYIKHHADRGETGVDRRKIAEAYIQAIEDKDIVPLRNIMNGINPEVNRLFTAITGLPARTQKEADASIRSLNPERWDAWQKNEAEKREAEKAAWEESAKKDELDKILNEKVKYRGIIVSRRDLYDKLIRDGYNQVTETKKGIRVRYRLEYPKEERFITLGKKIEADYVKVRIAELTEKPAEAETSKPETKAEAPAAKKEDPYRAAVGVVGAGVADRIKESKYEFAYGETKTKSDTYYDMAGMFSGGKADRLIEAGITIQKKKETVPEEPTYGADNKIFTKEKADKAKEILRQKLGGTQLNMGLDPEIISAGIDLAGYHIEAGARKFVDYARKMIEDIGDVVRPYLKSFYMAARNYPGFDKTGMNTEAELDEIDENTVTLEDKKALMGILERNDLVYYRKSHLKGLATGDFRENKGGYIVVVGGGGLTTEVFPEDILRAERNGEPIDVSKLPKPLTKEGEESILESQGGKRNEHSADGSTGAGALESDQPGSLPADGGRRGADGKQRGGGQTDNERDEGADADRDDEAGSLAGEPTPIHLSDEGEDSGVVSAGSGRAGESDPLNQEEAPASEPRTPKLSGINPGNYQITDKDDIGGGTRGQKIDANLAAIRLVKQLDQEKRYPTKEEQSILAKYVGWGGLKSVFDKSSSKAQDQRAREELEKLLTKEEYLEAFVSMTNAHYTSPEIIKSIYKIVKHFGFTGGNILEPTYGVGNFIGLAPSDIAASSNYYGSELDIITAKIGQYLYPESQLIQAGFQNAEFPFGKFDLAVGNPPFGDERIADTRKSRAEINRFKIHNYIIAKEGLHLKPGGILANVVTTRFLDTADPEARDFLAKHFKFLGAIRLPNDAFAKNAGTEVTTDIVFFQRLLPNEAPDLTASWLETGATMKNAAGEEVTLNRYFAEHPELMLGEPSMKGTMYGGSWKEGGKGEFTLDKREGENIGDLIDGVLETQFADLKGVMQEQSDDKADAAALALTINREDVGIGGFYKDGEKIYMRGDNDQYGNPTYELLTENTIWSSSLTPDGQGGYTRTVTKDKKKQTVHYKNKAAVPAALKLGDTRLNRIKGMLTLRKMAYDLVNAERFDLPDIEEKRKELNKTYDAFVKEYGYLSENANFSLMADDVKIEFGLENGFKKGITPARAKALGIAPSPASAEKATILTERMFYPDKEILYAKNPMDGYSISLSQKGRLDLDYISQLTGKTKDEVIRQLSKDGMIYQDPETKEWIQEDEYLSGNVKEKYKKVAGKEGFEKNAEALKKVFPPDKPTDKIFANPGAPWIPTRYYEQFGDFIGLEDVRVTLYRDTGHFNMSAGGRQQNDINVEWINEYFSLDEIFNAVANNKVLIAYDGHGDDRVQNREQTKVLANTVKEMRNTFYDWIFADEARARDLTRIYNETQNTHAERVYQGEHLRTVGANPAIILRNTQRNAAWRIIQSAKVLLDHCVGAGKTFTIITGVQERVRMGLTRKAMIVVPNHLVGQWAADYMKLYPGARILAATKKDFTRSNRRRLFARIATGKYDAVIVGHSSFGFIPIETESVTNLIMEEIEHLERAHAQAEESGNKRLIKSLAKRIQKKRERINELLGRERDNVTNFEAMGIDHLIVDESHEFKNLEYSSAMQNITGMGNPMGSKKAFDLYLKIRWLTSQRDYALNFATGTPISNSLVELYALLRYMNREALVSRGLEAFDAWASSYAAIENKIEYTATQKLKDRTIMSTFNNLRELLQLYKEFADTVTMDDLKRIYAEQIRERNARTGGNESEEFPIPHVEGGGRNLDVADATEEQSEYVDYLVARAETLEDQGASADPKIDNHLWIMSDARKMALDIRLVDPYAPDHPNNKINRATRSIKEIYDKTTDVRGTQLVFCDLSTPSGQARKNADSFIREALKKARLDGDRQVKIILGTLGTYQDKWGYIRNRLEAEIDAISEHALAETDQYMKRREEIEEFLEKTGDDVVADLTTADTGFSVYDEMKSKLIDMGIPEGEIRFIHDANSDPKKQELFDLVNAGKVRVLFGSSMKMGAGMNVQERLVALHHMDAPWRPSDVEQREGRAIRQGNSLYEADPKGFTVAVKAYSTKNTFDAVMWGILARKAAMLDDFRNGADSVTDTSTDGASFAIFMASSTGNPAFLEKFELEGELEILNAIKRKTQTRLRSAKQSLEYNKKAREREKDFIARREEILEELKDKTSFTYKGKSYEDKAKEIVNAEQEEIYDYNRSVDKEYNEAHDTAIKEAFGKLGIEVPKKPDGADYTDREELMADLREYTKFWTAKNEKIAAEAIKGIKKKPHKHLHYDKLAKSDKSGTIAAGLEMLQEINDLDVGGVFSFKLGDANVSIEKMESSELRGEGSEVESFDFVVTAGGALGDGVFVERTKKVKAYKESDLWDIMTVRYVQTRIESGLDDNKRNVWMMDREDETSRDTLEKLRFKDEEKLKDKTERYAAVLEEVRAAEAEMDERRAEQFNKYIEQDTTRFPDGYNPRRDTHEAPGPIMERIEADIDNISLNELRVKRDQIGGGIENGEYEDDDLVIKFAEMARAEAILSRYGDGNIEKAQNDLQEAKKGWDEFHEGEEYPYEIKLAEHIITSINNKQGKLFKGQQYSIGNQRSSMPTLKDVQKAFKGLNVTQLDDGSFMISLADGRSLIVQSVDHLGVNQMALSVGYSKNKLGENEVVAGRYHKGTITLVRGVGGKWTLRHEQTHWLEDIGLLSRGEVALLQRHIQRLVAEGKLKTRNQKDVGGAEDRADFLADALTKEPQGMLGRIIAKIQDFIDKLVNAFGIRTVRGIARDIKTGDIYNRNLTGQPEAVTLFSVTKDKGAGKIPDKTTPQAEAGLIQEAKKYKTVEEFVNAQGIEAWHGSRHKIEGELSLARGGEQGGDITKNGFTFSTQDVAEKYRYSGLSRDELVKMFGEADAKAIEDRTSILHGRIKMENPLLVDASGYDYKSKHYTDQKEGLRSKAFTEYIKQMEDGGHDGIIFTNVKDTPGKKADTTVYFIKDKNKFKTEEQLTHIWNKAHQLPNPSRPPEVGGQYSIREQQDPPTSRDPKVLNLYLKDETDALVQTMMNKLHPQHMTWLETMLKSPEWFGHPQIQNIVKLFMRDRNEIYHETFNDLNMADDIDAPENTVTEAAKALKNKGLSLADRLAGKVSPEYQRLQEIIDEGDTTWKRNRSIPLAKQIKEFEDHVRRNGATEETIRVWKLYRQSYDKALDLQTAQLRQMIEEITEEANFRGEKPDLNELKQTLKGALAQMEEWRGFYAPRLRTEGNWKIQAYKEHGPMRENREWYREHRGSELSARRLANKLQREGWKIYSVGQVEKLPETIYQDVNAAATAKLIDAALEKLSKKSALTNELTTKFNEEVLREVSNAIKARGFRSTMIHRGEKVIRGFIEDPIQRHLQYTNSLSGGISKARVARMAMKELLGEKFEGKQIGGIDPVKDPKAFQVAQNYIEEQLRNIEPIDRMIGVAKSIATFKFLGFNIRSLAVNTTAIITTAPAAIHQYALDGKGSLMGIIKELAVSGKDYAAMMAGRKLANADEQAFLDEVHKKGWDDAQYTREALGEISKTHSRIWSSMMDGSMYLFGKSEKWNRGTTMLAAYRLARKRGMSHAEAAGVAKEASDKAHGVYGKSTMPMWAQGTNPAAKLGQMFYVYQKFGHNYLQMLYDMGLKKHNIKGAMFAFLSPLVLAGGAALPFKDAIFSAAGVILSALFGEDRDPEKWVWDEIRKHLGPEAEKLGRHGLTGAMGVDISSSLSAGVGIPKSFIDLTGAIGGAATELKEAGESIRNKQYGKAAEHLLPTGFANPIRAIRESSQGVSTRNNRPVWDETGKQYKPGAGATAARAFGFRSTDQAVLSERTWEGHRQQADFADKRNAIYERYRAWMMGKRDREEYKEIVKEVQEYNRTIRENRIVGVSPITSQSLKDQARRMAAPSKNERALLR